MAYVPGSTLERKTPFTDKDGAGLGANGTDTDLTVYNEVKVIGPSPVVEAGKPGEWEGSAGTGVLIQPISFGAVLDRPQGELERDYDVTDIPEQPLAIQQRQVAVRQEPGKTPEEAFAAEALANAQTPAKD